jgi:DNA-binding MarR family transcriptional regulator
MREGGSMAEPGPRLDPIEEAQRLWSEHGWAGAADGMAMVTAVMRVQQILLQRVDAVLRPLGLTFARYEILMLLSFSRSGSMPMKRLGSRLQVHATSVTSAVDRLVAQGYVERKSDASDRRSVLASITPAGRAIAGQATAAINSDVFESPGLGSKDVNELNRLLRSLRIQAGDF